LHDSGGTLYCAATASAISCLIEPADSIKPVKMALNLINRAALFDYLYCLRAIPVLIEPGGSIKTGKIALKY
jgi:hypothetical protein